jgi:hypothetical protein
MNNDLLEEARFLAGHCRWLTSHGMEDDEDDSALLGSLSSILDKLADEIERLAEVGIKGEVKE